MSLPTFDTLVMTVGLLTLSTLGVLTFLVLVTALILIVLEAIGLVTKRIKTDTNNDWLIMQFLLWKFTHEKKQTSIEHVENALAKARNYDELFYQLTGTIEHLVAVGDEEVRGVPELERKTLYTWEEAREAALKTVEEYKKYLNEGLPYPPKKPTAGKPVKPKQTAETEVVKHEASCSSCGTWLLLPFKPAGNRPIYCQSCFENNGGSSA